MPIANTHIWQTYWILFSLFFSSFSIYPAKEQGKMKGKNDNNKDNQSSWKNNFNSIDSENSREEKWKSFKT